MASGATGTVSTNLLIPKINPSVDIPDGSGINSIVDFIDTALIGKTLLTTTGDIIYASAANTPARLAAGAVGTVLTSGGAGVAPSWSVASGVVAPTHIGNTSGYIGVWGGANSVYLTPIPAVVIAATFSRATIWDNAAGGTVDVGVYYSDDESTFTRVVSSGAITTLTAAGARIISLAATLTPVAGRRWYFAVAFSGAGTLWGGVCPLGYQKAGVGTTLPSTLTGMSAGLNNATYLLAV